MTVEERRDWLLSLKAEERLNFLSQLSQSEQYNLLNYWPFWARKEQLAPDGEWLIWLICAGRGFGKTRAGAEWVRQTALNDGAARIALIAASLGEARSVMVEGESGIMACHLDEQRPDFEPSLKRLIWPNGAEARLYSANEPESLRGPQHSHAWCDEIAKWEHSADRAINAWSNLEMGLRLGELPRILATTTPRTAPLLRLILDREKDGNAKVSRGSTFDNAANLPARFIQSMKRQYAGTNLARQELEGELLSDIEGALWNRSLIEKCRANDRISALNRVVIGVDPPASARGDECGIIVAGIDEAGQGQVLADASIAKASPEQWARAVANAAKEWDADLVVAEANQGGDMVASVLRAADCTMPVRLVHASRGKTARAEPIAALYETGKIYHIGNFSKLEDQLCGLMVAGAYEGPGRSPDRADALVWALTELMLSMRANPRLRQV